jgi:hypothetical protein
MWKLLGLALFVLSLGYVAYDYYRAGLHTRPDMPEGAFSISYDNGVRAIMVDVPDERRSRRYFAFPADVPFYLQEAWSFCTQPTQLELDQLMEARRRNPGERIDAVCRIDVDGESIVRAAIITVPRL